MKNYGKRIAEYMPWLLLTGCVEGICILFLALADVQVLQVLTGVLTLMTVLMYAGVCIYIVKKEQKKEEQRKERQREKEKAKNKKEQKKEGQNYKGRCQFFMVTSLILLISVVSMMLLAATSDNVNILNYENKLIDKYSSWEQELEEREQAVKEQEQALEEK